MFLWTVVAVYIYLKVKQPPESWALSSKLLYDVLHSGRIIILNTLPANIHLVLQCNVDNSLCGFKPDISVYEKTPHQQNHKKKCLIE